MDHFFIYSASLFQMACHKIITDLSYCLYNTYNLYLLMDLTENNNVTDHISSLETIYGLFIHASWGKFTQCALDQ